MKAPAAVSWAGGTICLCLAMPAPGDSGPASRSEAVGLPKNARLCSQGVGDPVAGRIIGFAIGSSGRCGLQQRIGSSTASDLVVLLPEAPGPPPGHPLSHFIEGAGPPCCACMPSSFCVTPCTDGSLEALLRRTVSSIAPALSRCSQRRQVHLQGSPSFVSSSTFELGLQQVYDGVTKQKSQQAPWEACLRVPHS